MNLKVLIRDTLAWMIAPILRRLAPDPKYFDLWQEHGFHVSQVHYYQPLPDTRLLKTSLWKHGRTIPGVELREAQQLELLELFASTYKSEYEAFPRAERPNSLRYFIGNSAFGAVDAEILYCMIRHFKPRRMIEVGSGFSTFLALSALAKNTSEGVSGSLHAIEPFPPPWLAANTPPEVKLTKDFVQNVSLAEFEALRAHDILFIDSSHVCKIGSDVHFELFEILPRLAPGVLIHVHDIFLPAEYPRPWVLERHLFWNEQYVLRSFLCFNNSFEILWAAQWVHLTHPDWLAQAFSSYNPGVSPASFWMRRVK